MWGEIYTETRRLSSREDQSKLIKQTHGGLNDREREAWSLHVRLMTRPKIILETKHADSTLREEGKRLIQLHPCLSGSK